VEHVNPFAGVIGHQRVLDLLTREAPAPANAYFFIGAAGVGKATVARRFAALLLCPDAGDHGRPDQADGCRSCRRVESGSHPDLILVEPEGRQSLGVEQARSTIQQASMSPVESPRKVFLFEEAGAMTEQAANALLKTLEEPTETTVFVLVAESEDQLPSTVASRCRTVHFGRVGEDELIATLGGHGIEPEQVATLARLAGGRPGLALSLVRSPQIAGFRTAWLSVPVRSTDRAGESFVLAQEMLATVDPLIETIGSEVSKEQAEKDRRRARQALLATGLEITASWYLDAAAVQLGGPIRNRDIPLALLTEVTPTRAVRNAERVMDAVVDLEANLRPQLLLADLFCDLAAE
jgi:DNA polymerase-3 subunit delta'